MKLILLVICICSIIESCTLPIYIVKNESLSKSKIQDTLYYSFSYIEHYDFEPYSRNEWQWASDSILLFERFSENLQSTFKRANLNLNLVNVKSNAGLSFKAIFDRSRLDTISLLNYINAISEHKLNKIFIHVLFMRGAMAGFSTGYGPMSKTIHSSYIPILTVIDNNQLVFHGRWKNTAPLFGNDNFSGKRDKQVSDLIFKQLQSYVPD